ASEVTGEPSATLVALQPELALTMTFVGQVIEGAVLSTEKVALGPAAGAVLLAEIGGVSGGVERHRGTWAVGVGGVTVRVVPEPEMRTVPLALPVLFRVTFVASSVLALKLMSA